jgi:plastocyanin
MMNLRRTPAILIAAAALTTTVAACGGSSGPKASGGGSTSLAIASFAYSPNPLTVAPGTKISVSNSDSQPHTVTSTTAGQFDAHVAGGSSASFTAPSSAGTFTYTCTIHPQMKGTLVVK